jgi:hypothetical protein
VPYILMTLFTTDPNTLVRYAEDEYNIWSSLCPMNQ